MTSGLTTYHVYVVASPKKIVYILKKNNNNRCRLFLTHFIVKISIGMEEKFKLDNVNKSYKLKPK